MGFNSRLGSGTGGGAGTAADLTVDDSNFDVLVGTDAQTVFESVDEALLNSISTGVKFGGEVTIATASTIDISAGEGAILDNTAPNAPVYHHVTWSQSLGLTPPAGLSYYYVNNAGTITYTTTTPSHEDYRLYIFLARVSVSGGVITAINPIPVPIQQNSAQIWDVFRAYGLTKRDLVVSANGANLKIDVSAGEIYQAGINFFNDATNPHEATFGSATAVTFRMATSTGTIAADVTDLPVGNYDVGGVVTAIPGASNRTTIFTVYKFPQGNVRILYGTAYYNSITDATTALASYYPQPPTGYDQAIIIGYILAHKGATDLSDSSQSRFILTNKFGLMGGALAANFSGFLQIANNLSDLASSATARVNLQLDKQTNGGNANYSILSTDKTVYTGTAFTTARTWTLPSAASVNPGYEVIVIDELQTITSTNTLTIGVQVGEKLNGTTNGTEVMSSAGGSRRLISDGSTGWFYDAAEVRLSKAQTISNKRITKRKTTVTSSATPTLNTDNTDIARLTGLSVNITNASTNLTGTPEHGDLFSYEITDNGVARTISWGTSFSNSGTLTLPTTTVASTMLRCLFQWNSTTSKWEIVAVV